jgi:predicted nucleic acid-binding protein
VAYDRTAAVIFVDTNVLSEFGNVLPESKVTAWVIQNLASLQLSVIVHAELLRGAEGLPTPTLRRRIRARYDDLLAELPPPHVVDAKLSEEAAALFGKSRRRGSQMGLADALIAATALRHHAPLATRNVKDFKATGLTLIDPWNAP